MNAARDVDRHRRLLACARHAAKQGVILIERWTHEQAARLRVGEVHVVDGVEIVALDVARNGPVLSVALAHRVDGQEWVQRFEARVLDEGEFVAALSLAGLQHVAWLDDARAWSVSRPLSR